MRQVWQPKAHSRLFGLTTPKIMSEGHRISEGTLLASVELPMGLDNKVFYS